MKILKKISAALIAAMLCLSFTACAPEVTDEGNNPPESTAGTIAATDTEEPKAAVVIDREGNELVIPDNIEKIVSASPSNTEILIGLGLKDKIVAADTFSYDTGIDPSLAVIDMMNVNLEEIIALSPDVVIINGISMVGADDPYKAIKDAGIEVLYIPSAASLNDIKEDISFISAYTKTEDKGNEMISTVDEAVALVKSAAENVTEKKKVYFEVSSAPYCYSCGKGTYVNEIIELAGAENIFGAEEGWLPASEESIIAMNPDVILTSVAYDGYDYKEILGRAGWDVTNAVKSEAVYQVDANATGRASQNVVKGIEEITRAIYPEIYK